MDVTRMHEVCAGFPGAWPDNPWDHDHPVFKVGPGERGKIFAFLGATGVASRPAPPVRSPTSGSTAIPTTPP